MCLYPDSMCVIFTHFSLYEYKIQILVYLTSGVMFSNIYTYVYHFIFISCEYFRYDDKLWFCLYWWIEISTIWYMKFRGIKKKILIFPSCFIDACHSSYSIYKGLFGRFKKISKYNYVKRAFLSKLFHNARFSVQMQLWTIRKSKLNESNVERVCRLKAKERSGSCPLRESCTADRLRCRVPIERPPGHSWTSDGETPPAESVAACSKYFQWKAFPMCYRGSPLAGVR
jgi:hypothetical protein